MTFINTRPINAADERGRVAPRAPTRAKHPFIRTSRRLWNIQHSFLCFFFFPPFFLFFLVVLIAKTPVTSFLSSFFPSFLSAAAAAFPQNQSEELENGGSQKRYDCFSRFPRTQRGRRRRGRRRWAEQQKPGFFCFFFSSSEGTWV